MIPKRDRRLLAAFMLFGNPLVWACNQCGKMFFISIDEAKSECAIGRTTTEFNSHLCAVPELPLNRVAECEVTDISLWPNQPKDPNPGRE